MFRDVIEETIENSFNVRDEYKSKTVDELKEICKKDSLPYRVCMLNVEGDLNIGMSARTASLLGAEKFYVFGRRKIDRRSLVGAQNYLPIERVDGLDEKGNISLDKFIAFCNAEEIEPVLVEHGGLNIENFDWKGFVNITCGNLKRTMCLVFGNESTGIPREFTGFWKVRIPQRGVLRSYNVASCASIVMWDVYKVLTT